MKSASAASRRELGRPWNQAGGVAVGGVAEGAAGGEDDGLAFRTLCFGGRRHLLFMR